jgi:hypothetical protein
LGVGVEVNWREGCSGSQCSQNPAPPNSPQALRPGVTVKLTKLNSRNDFPGSTALDHNKEKLKELNRGWRLCSALQLGEVASYFSGCFHIFFK